MKIKYIYYRVIQEFWGSWEDSDFHETNSKYTPFDRKAFKENLKSHRENSPVSVRVINRREKNV